MLNFPKPNQQATAPQPQGAPAQPAPQHAGPPVVGGQYVEPLGPPFLPFEAGVYLVHLKSFIFRNGFSGPAYYLNFRVLESNHPAVRVGMDHALRYSTAGGDPQQANYRYTDLCNLTGAIFQQDPKTIDVNGAIQTLLGAGESLESNGIKLSIIGRPRVSKKTGKASANFSFASVA